MGVFVALVALLATASAQTESKTETKKAAPAKKAPAKADAKSGKAAPKAADAPADVTDGAAGSAEAEHVPTLEEIEAQLPPHQTGPKHVDLGNNIEIDLPAGMILFEHTEAKMILEQGGDPADNVNAIIMKREGLIEENAWEILIEYDDVGYVTDKDADELNPDELFQSYKQGTDQQNIQRKAKGIPELLLDGWSEMPKYNKGTHHLVWGLKAHTTEGPVINFFTRVLGRSGYMSINLIDSPDRIEASKTETAVISNATRFKAGSTYEDHAEGDKSSGMGLRALVIGGTGLAVLKVAKGGLLLKLLKPILVGLAAIGAFLKRLFSRNKNADVQPVSYDTPPTDGSST